MRIYKKFTCLQQWKRKIHIRICQNTNKVIDKHKWGYNNLRYKFKICLFWDSGKKLNFYFYLCKFHHYILTSSGSQELSQITNISSKKMTSSLIFFCKNQHKKNNTFLSYAGTHLEFLSTAIPSVVHEFKLNKVLALNQNLLI